MILPVDLAFFGANLLKIDDGGWFSLVVAAFGLRVDDHLEARAHACCASGSRRPALPLELFLPDLETAKLPRVPGTAVFMTGDPQGTPLALLHNFKHNKVLHEHNVLLTLVTEDVPYVADEERVTVKPLGHGFFRVVAHYGFMELPDVPELLRQVRSAALPIDLERTSYFLGRERADPVGPLRHGALARVAVLGHVAERAERDHLLPHPARPGRRARRAGRAVG